MPLACVFARQFSWLFGFDFNDTGGSKLRTLNRVQFAEIQSSKRLIIEIPSNRTRPIQSVFPINWKRLAFPVWRRSMSDALRFLRRWPPNPRARSRRCQRRTSRNIDGQQRHSRKIPSRRLLDVLAVRVCNRSYASARKSRPRLSEPLSGYCLTCNCVPMIDLLTLLSAIGQFQF